MGKKCFVISVIGDAGSDNRKHADDVLDFIIKPAALRAGYAESNIVRADRMDETGQITRQIVEAILNFEMVIADLSKLNANVFYELAIRHSTGRPTIHIMQSGTHLPFDLQQTRCVPFDLSLRGAGAAVDDLVKKIEAAERGKDERADNPVTAATLSGELAKVHTDVAGVLKDVLDSQGRVSGLVLHLAHQVSALKAMVLPASTLGLLGPLPPVNALMADPQSARNALARQIVAGWPAADPKDNNPAKK